MLGTLCREEMLVQDKGDQERLPSMSFPLGCPGRPWVYKELVCKQKNPRFSEEIFKHALQRQGSFQRVLVGRGNTRNEGQKTEQSRTIPPPLPLESPQKEKEDRREVRKSRKGKYKVSTRCPQRPGARTSVCVAGPRAPSPAAAPPAPHTGQRPRPAPPFTERTRLMSSGLVVWVRAPRMGGNPRVVGKLGSS